MKLEDLKEGKYYTCKGVDMNYHFYFKFKKYDNDFVYSHGFELRELDNVFEEYVDSDHVFCDINFFNRCVIFKEINIGRIIHHLPDEHIDKKIFFRQRKIECLLKNEIKNNTIS